MKAWKCNQHGRIHPIKDSTGMSVTELREAVRGQDGSRKLILYTNNLIWAICMSSAI